MRSLSLSPAIIPRVVAHALVLVALVPSLARAASSRGSFDRAPFYHGKPKAPVRPAAHAPVQWRAEPGSLDPGPDRSPALAALLDSLRVAIDRQTATTPLAIDPRLAGAPDVRFGARRGGMAPDGTPRPPDEIDPTERRMTFEVEGPAKPWREQARAAGGAVRAIVTIQLGFGEYWVRQKDWKGGKRVELGSGRFLELPWLTSLDDPVQVLQLTGALVSPDGRVLRVGAEALIARRTGMGASVLGAQEILTEEDLATLHAGDPGAETWRVALRTLIANLVGARS